MSQRNPLNERYNSENRTGKTRKSAASAKPKAERAATLRDPVKKTPKEKKKEAREREREQLRKAEQMAGGRYEDTPEYKKLRRIWWALLGSAIAFTALSFWFSTNEAMANYSTVVIVIAYALIIAAFYIDLGKIRKARKAFNANLVYGRSKEARREQKRMRAEAREQEKEAAEKYEAAKAEEEAKKEARKEGGLLGRFGKSKKAEETADATKAK